MDGKLQTAKGDLVIDYGFDGDPYTYCPWTDEPCDHPACTENQTCRNDAKRFGEQ